jgi:hypothetical protein
MIPPSFFSESDTSADKLSSDFGLPVKQSKIQLGISGRGEEPANIQSFGRPLHRRKEMQAKPHLRIWKVAARKADQGHFTMTTGVSFNRVFSAQ